ncbi:hypothetical protein GGR51DRAFT_526107 [Nemania sp. FL0031]|nr:hypothetical protein GGR51DRAFT_526107 [Nemania sp. FL0031]
MSLDSGSGSEVVAKDTETENNLDKIRADVEKLVEAIQSLVPPPKPTQPERRFSDPVERVHNVDRDKAGFYVDFLLSMFNRDNDGNSRDPWISMLEKTFHDLRWPIFAHKLTLVASGKKDVKIGMVTEDLIIQLRSYVVSKLENDYLEVDHTGFGWKFLHHGNFKRYIGRRGRDNNEPFTPWIVTSRSPLLNLQLLAKNTTMDSLAHGAICIICNPIEDRILGFRWISFILAQICRPALGVPNSAQGPTVMCFLGVFSGQWLPRQERDLFAYEIRNVHHQTRNMSLSIRLSCLQIHFRCFEAVKSLKRSQGTDGLMCYREQGQIPSKTGITAPYYFEERRISMFGVLSVSEQTEHQGDYFVPPSQSSPVYYNILILGDFKFDPSENWKFEWSAGLEGTVAFHAALFECVSIWQTKWNGLLDDVDEHISVRLEDTLDPNEIDKWMFDETGFERSKLYVTVLQVLRIFSEYIPAVSDDLRSLDRLFLQEEDFPMTNMTPEELRMMRSNWKSVKEFQKKAEDILLGRISQKTEEVKSLRDGLFNASSLREANNSSREARRATSMGRYVLVFTVVTILYLPPSFISTVFALDIFKTDIAQGKWEYKVSLVSVSLVTYLLAFASIIAVDWKGFKKRWVLLWKGFENKLVVLLEGFWRVLAPISFKIFGGCEPISFIIFGGSELIKSTYLELRKIVRVQLAIIILGGWELIKMTLERRRTTSPEMP